MSLIKFIVLSLTIFTLFSCASAPKSWDGYSGKMYLKIFKTTCVKSAKAQSPETDLEEEIDTYIESACDCIVKQIPILYPNPSAMPNNFKDEPEWIEASQMCIEKHTPEK